MKRIFITGCFVLLALVMGSCGSKISKDVLQMDVQLSDALDSVDVMLVEYGSTTMDRKRQALADGRFEMALPLVQPMSVRLIVPGDHYHMGIEFPGVPGEKVIVRGSFDDYSLSGSKFYQEYSAVSDLLKPDFVELGRQRENIEALFAELTKDREKNAERIKEENEKYNKTYQALYDDLRQKACDYLAAHPGQESSVPLLMLAGSDKVEENVARMDAKVVNGRMKPVIDALRKQAENQRIRKEAEASVKEGVMAPDFTLPDIDGNPFTLSSLRGKWVVLDFWGSWCGWCIKGIPDMKKYYEKYAGKLEIVGIDCRDTQEKWKAAVAKHELPWLHVYNKDADGTPDKYAVQGYPTKIIIDPDGKINKIVIGESEEFYKYLDELFS